MSFLLYLLIINIITLNKVLGGNISLAEKLNDTRYTYDVEALDERDPQYPIHPILLGRVSRRQMSGENMTDTELFTLFEAARWAPSYYNLQEWRFVYAKRESKYWKGLFDVLDVANQEWVKNASALVAVISFNHNIHHNVKQSNPTHSSDAGVAWMSMAIEGTSRGYVVHPMAGFDYKKAIEVIKLNATDYTLEMFLAIGKRLPIDQRISEAISQRLPVDMFVSEGELEEKIFLDV